MYKAATNTNLNSSQINRAKRSAFSTRGGAQYKIISSDKYTIKKLKE
jgi:hypothetical protein